MRLQWRKFMHLHPKWQLWQRKHHRKKLPRSAAALQAGRDSSGHV